MTDRSQAGGHSGPEDTTSATLLSRLRVQDGDAWVRLDRLYGPLVRHWAARRGVTGSDADDVGQEVLRAVATGIEGFRRDRPGDSFRGWLYGITRLVLIRRAERQANEARAAGGTEALRGLNEVPDRAAEPDGDDVSSTEMAALYRRGLELVRGEFEAKTWRAFWEHVVDGRPVADVADGLGVSPAAIRQAKSRVLRRLREELGELID